MFVFGKRFSEQCRLYARIDRFGITWTALHKSSIFTQQNAWKLAAWMFRKKCSAELCYIMEIDPELNDKDLCVLRSIAMTITPEAILLPETSLLDPYWIFKIGEHSTMIDFFEKIKTVTPYNITNNRKMKAPLPLGVTIGGLD